MIRKPFPEHFFENFYEKQFDKVFHFVAQRVKNREDARDLVHDIFIKVYKNIDKIIHSDSQDAYLFSIVRNTLIDYYRKSLTEIETIDNPTQLLAVEAAPGTVYFSSDQIQIIHAEIDALPKQRREIFKLKRLEGLSTEEISHQLSISKRTVENQVYRATLTLRKRLASLLNVFL